MSATSYGKMERQNHPKPIPRWLIYTVAWTLLYGTEQPFEDDDIPERLRETRKRYTITQDEMGSILGVSHHIIRRTEYRLNFHPEFGWALAWIRLYGSKLPYALGQSLPLKGGVRCPLCSGLR